MSVSPAAHWEQELARWLAPFLQHLRRKAQRQWAPFYLKGLILPGECRERGADGRTRCTK